MVSGWKVVVAARAIGLGLTFWRLSAETSDNKALSAKVAQLQAEAQAETVKQNVATMREKCTAQADKRFRELGYDDTIVIGFDTEFKTPDSAMTADGVHRP
jgi:hypothetical protein